MATKDEIQHRKEVLKVMDYTIRRDIAPWCDPLHDEWLEIYPCEDEEEIEALAADDDLYLLALRGFAAINVRFIDMFEKD